MKKNLKKDQKIQIIVDTREQKPLLWENYDDTIVWRDKLDCGDYSLAAYDMPKDDFSIIIERKASCLELIRNLGANWDTFKRELEKLKEYNTAIITVCEPNKFWALYSSGKTKMHPNYLESRLMEILLMYNIPTYFFKNRNNCELYLHKLFIKNKSLIYGN